MTESHSKDNMLFQTEINNNNNNNVPLVTAIPISDEYTINKPVYSKFIQDTMLCLFFQIAVTASTCIVSYTYKDEVTKYILTNPSVVDLTLFTYILTIMVLICCDIKNTFIRWSLFIGFTLSSALMVSICLFRYSPIIILQATTATSISVLTINMYAFICHTNGYDFSSMNGLIYSCSFSIITIVLISLFIPYNSVLQLVFAGVFTVLFTIYLFYDLLILYNKDNELIFQSPIYASISIYLDIINLFLNILKLFAGCEE